MRGENRQFSNFTNAITSTSYCYRPDNEQELMALGEQQGVKHLLVRGNGLSYSDCCLNDDGIIIDASRFNHFLSFDETTGVLVCQGSVTFAELFRINAQFIPPVIPGTLHATLAGGVANDVHGKNNHFAGSIGHHIEWFTLQIGKQNYHCSPKENKELFYATIAGLGLTGIIKKIAIRLRKAPAFVESHTEKFINFQSLLQRMQTEGCHYDYQVAWLDLINEPRALLSCANHCEAVPLKQQQASTVPWLPFRVINSWIMKQFNRFYFNAYPTKKIKSSLQHFNNPLDAISHWNRLYGKKGFLQFQAIIDADSTEHTLKELITLIRHHQAEPTLAVLKYFTQSGFGLLSFAQPGFTIAIDFINNQQARAAILAMNNYISQQKGKVYLAKDVFLTPEQFHQQYANYKQFIAILDYYQSHMASNLSARLRIRP